MNTNLLQSQLARNAEVITFYHAERIVKIDTARGLKKTGAKALASVEYHTAGLYTRSIKKMAEIQRAIKEELRRNKPARVSKKHGPLH